MTHSSRHLLTAALIVAIVVALTALALESPRPSRFHQGAAAAAPDKVVARQPQVAAETAHRDRERGTRFRPDVRSRVLALRYYRVRGDTARHQGRLWSASGERRRTVVFSGTRRVGWQKATLDRAMTVRAARAYVASFSSPGEVVFAVERGGGSSAGAGYSLGRSVTGRLGRFPSRALRGERFLVRPVLVSASSDPAPTSFPDAASTGVPDGVLLTPYGGGSTVRSDGTVIDSRRVDGTLWIEARDVVIRRTFVAGNIVVSPNASVTLTDATVDGGTFNGSAVGQYNITLRRVEVLGARQSVSCNENCDIQDSWLHAQYMEPGSDWHGDGFISNGGSDMLVRHNTLACDSQPTDNAGACTAAVALFADFGPLSSITIDANLFTASPAAYCLYGGYDPGKPFGANPTGIVITGNVFQRGANRNCATFGPVTAIADGGPGNVYAENVWEDGRRVPAP